MLSAWVVCREIGMNLGAAWNRKYVSEGETVHIIITDAWLTKSRTLHLNGVNLVVASLLASVFVMLGAVAAYHWVFLQGVRNGWPGFESVARIVSQGQIDANELYMRENLAAMAKKLGEMQARMMQLESLGERVAGLAGLNPDEFKGTPGAGGTVVDSRDPTLEELMRAMNQLDRSSGAGMDWLTVVESRLFDQNIARALVPTERPVKNGRIGSSFGYRIDPFNGRTAYHTGLDFPADVGTPITAAAGGVVVVVTTHPAYGEMLEIDHGNNLITRYAHNSRILVNKGDIVKRGQLISEVGSTGRSTGPHLHFEVLVSGVQQDPGRFLAAGESLTAAQTLAAAQRRP